MIEFMQKKIHKSKENGSDSRISGSGKRLKFNGIRTGTKYTEEIENII